ncbi:MAG: S8 family serine peptidase [Trueperaceae bacterium]|nr:S8 family serine peptidase [Trueperaceae bacterium]
MATSQADLEKAYGGKAIIFKPEAGFAILGFSKEAGELSTLTTSVNQNALTTPEVNASGFSAWAGGWSAWAGGWSAWAGGWSAWAGGTGTIPTTPSENRFAFNQINLAPAFTFSKNFGEGIKVAVIDTGIDLNHSMFSDRLAPSNEWKDYVDGDNYPQDVSGGGAYGHGTAVAGLILQVAPKADILPIRVLKNDGSGDVSAVASAIDWAVQKNADIINLSLGTNVDVAALKSMIDYATSRHIYVIASAGNEGNSNSISYPAAYATSGTNAQYLISVGSTQSNSTLSPFSNRSSALEIAAPGEWLYTSYPGNQIAEVIGTSFSAPIVSGALALAASETSSTNLSGLETYLLNGGWAISASTRHLNVKSMLSYVPDFQYWRKVLFVVGSYPMTPADQLVNDQLWQMGFNVTVKVGGSSATSDATGKDLVVISSTVTPADVNTKYRNVSVPVITWEAALFDDLGMVTASSGYYGTASNQTSISVSNNTHPLSAALRLGDLSEYGPGAAYSSGQTLSWGKPTSSAIKIATLTGDASKAVIFGYDPGTSMVGLNAPARRLGFMFNDTSPLQIRDSWWTDWLFKAAINWAVSGN